MFGKCKFLHILGHFYTTLVVHVVDQIQTGTKELWRVNRALLLGVATGSRGTAVRGSPADGWLKR